MMSMDRCLFLHSLKIFYSVFMVLLTKIFTWFEPEVCKNGWDFLVAE